ncbi:MULTISPECIES: CdaR family transcriptional regulator [unclassified Streptomyces]|uniref:PucR family transcriptional regulator n=1 Tax=unclassified Streptomyces TaxID=2593676 RepID=UPI00035DF75C|nr:MULTISPECIES: helix-turn-helix domain-containing protein [unclassified Streptomyces]MYQ80094.1 PucR family transcriptional regulator [Streptomyces sp. SID4923]NEC07186.1 PucR family transcriptional regulator [Streptomyces sp. SID7909]OKI96993.1 CdaR family transcriptional regulator [Streptomyces sp. CB01249]
MAIAGRPVAVRLRARVPALTTRVVARLLSDLPVYAELPHEEIAGDIADIVQHNLRLFADVLEHRRAATDGELAQQRDSAAQRAEEGVPLDAILTAYQVGVAMCWEETAQDAGPGDLPAVLEIMDRILVLQQQLTSAVSGAYLEARQILDSQEHGGRHALMAALLTGEDLDGFTRRTGLRPAARYLTMTLALAPHPDETGAGPARGAGAGVAARRKIRRIRTTLDRFAGTPALTALDASGGTVLLPVAEPPRWDGPGGLCDLIAEATRAAGVPVTAAAETAAPDGVPAAVARNGEIVDLVARTGRAPGLYRLADVLLEYQLSRPSEALRGLAGLLSPLDAKPELLHTLETYLAHGLDRRAAAAALHVHPNTVDYRIRRIDRLTGLSPARPADLQHLSAALVARRSV